MSKIGAQPDGIREIPNFAWLIKIGNRTYIYSGKSTGLNAAVTRVMDDKYNAGRKIHLSKLVS